MRQAPKNLSVNVAVVSEARNADIAYNSNVSGSNHANA